MTLGWGTWIAGGTLFFLFRFSLSIIVEHHDNDRMHYRASVFAFAFFSPLRILTGGDWSGWMAWIGLGWGWAHHKTTMGLFGATLLIFLIMALAGTEGRRDGNGGF